MPRMTGNRYFAEAVYAYGGQQRGRATEMRPPE
jgi:hypothetical protein